MGGGQRKAEVAVLIHGGHLDHSHIHGGVAVAVEPGQLGVAHGNEVSHTLADDLAVDAAAVPAVPGEVLAGVLRLADLGHPHGDAAPDLYVPKLVLPGGQSLIQSNGVVGAPTIVHPVPALDNLHRFSCGGQLLLIHCAVIHDDLLRI